MSDKTTLGSRMKENYENRTKQFLMRRTPTILRLDGKAFHTFCKGMEKPFDDGFREDMQLTTAFLCENIQGAKCGYTQSDEITILLTDYDKLTTDAWFDYNLQKMVSVSASMATAKFNQLRLVRELKDSSYEMPMGDIGYQTLAFFDSRVFQISDKEEVVNCFLWRQQDAEKNSVSMLAQSLYSTKELHKKHGGDMQEMCFQKGYNWNDLSAHKKRGSFIVKNTYVDGKLLTEETEILDKSVTRTKWETLEETPFFGREREQILKFL